MGAFGIRRPLRFLTHKLELDEPQVSTLAAVLDDFKTERGQADVDKRRAQKLLAEAVTSEPFDEEKARQAAKIRTEATERFMKVVAEGLKTLNGVLSENQRQRLVQWKEIPLLRDLDSKMKTWRATAQARELRERRAVRLIQSTWRGLHTRMPLHTPTSPRSPNTALEGID